MDIYRQALVFGLDNAIVGLALQKKRGDNWQTVKFIKKENFDDENDHSTYTALIEELKGYGVDYLTAIEESELSDIGEGWKPKSGEKVWGIKWSSNEWIVEEFNFNENDVFSIASYFLGWLFKDRETALLNKVRIVEEMKRIFENPLDKSENIIV